MTLKSVACIDDLRRIAHRKVPRDFMDYYESGSYSEATLASNRHDLAQIKIRQHVLAGASNRESFSNASRRKNHAPVRIGADRHDGNGAS